MNGGVHLNIFFHGTLMGCMVQNTVSGIEFTDVWLRPAVLKDYY